MRFSFLHPTSHIPLLLQPRKKIRRDFATVRSIILSVSTSLRIFLYVSDILCAHGVNLEYGDANAITLFFIRVATG